MKLLFALALISIFAVLAARAEEKEIFKCVQGIGYQENKCNYCHCSKGELACTYMACFSEDSERLANCEVGTTWEEGCEKCWCVEKMGTVCTTDCGKKHKTHH